MAGVQQLVPAVEALARLLREAIEAAAQPDPVHVIVGARNPVEAHDFFMVSAPADGGAGIVMRPAASDQGHSQAIEFDIFVLISTYSPHRDIETRMRAAQDLLNLFLAVVEANPDLAGTVDIADVGGSGQMATFDDQDGCAVEFSLLVTCEIY